MRRLSKSIIGLTVVVSIGGSTAHAQRTAIAPEQRIANALASMNIRVVEGNLGLIPEGTPGRERVVVHLADLKKREKLAQAKADEPFLKTRAGKVWAKHKDWDRELCKVIADRKVRIGMTAEQVRLAWGKPTHINTTVRQANALDAFADGVNGKKEVSSTRKHELWIWGDSQFADFDDGVLTSVRQSN